MKPLQKITAEIVSAMLSDARLEPFDNGPTKSSFDYCDENYTIAGTCILSGSWRRSGDGYETPCEESLTDGHGYLSELFVSCRDEEADIEIPVSDADISELWQTLDAELAFHMKSYPY